jgi:hypothetical protein
MPGATARGILTNEKVNRPSAPKLSDNVASLAPKGECPPACDKSSSHVKLTCLSLRVHRVDLGQRRACTHRAGAVNASPQAPFEGPGMTAVMTKWKFIHHAMHAGYSPVINSSDA